MFSNALKQGDKLALPSLYGALHALSELGPEVIKTFIVPQVKNIGTINFGFVDFRMLMFLFCRCKD